MQLVELSDEYHLTTADALDLCVAAGINAHSSDAELNADQVMIFRNVAEQRLAFIEEQRDLIAARASSASRLTQDKDEREAGFGPLPPAPWEPGGAEEFALETKSNDTQSPLETAAAWHAINARQTAPSVSLLATTALALGVISLIFPFITAIVAIVLAMIAKNRIQASRGTITGERLATLAQVVSALGIALWFVLLCVALFRGWQATNAPLFNDPQIDIGDISWESLKVGDCVRVPRADISVSGWQGVSCDGPHEGEVYFTMELANPFGSSFPGRPALEPTIGAGCKEQFETYVGIAYNESTLQVGLFYPTNLNWVEQNDRTVGCIVYLANHNLINGTAKNSSR